MINSSQTFNKKKKKQREQKFGSTLRRSAKFVGLFGLQIHDFWKRSQKVSSLEEFFPLCVCFFLFSSRGQKDQLKVLLTNAVILPDNSTTRDRRALESVPSGRFDPGMLFLTIMSDLKMFLGIEKLSTT